MKRRIRNESCSVCVGTNILLWCNKHHSPNYGFSENMESFFSFVLWKPSWLVERIQCSITSSVPEVLFPSLFFNLFISSLFFYTYNNRAFKEIAEVYFVLLHYLLYGYIYMYIYIYSFFIFTFIS